MSQRPCNSESFQESDLIGKADVVEFHRMDDETWMPFPVEYKRWKPKMDDCVAIFSAALEDVRV